MLEPPQLSEEQLIACLRAAYLLPIVSVTFLPIGADPNSAVFCAVADDATTYFLKLRRGVVPEETIAMPMWLAQHGSTHVIPPIPTRTGALSTQLPPFMVLLYPFVD